MKALVIGASGHVGSYMVPALVQKGLEVTAISRGNREPYTKARYEWRHAHTVSADRAALEKNGEFGRFAMSFKPDYIFDLICYSPAQAEEIAQAAAGSVRQLVQIGSIWAYGYGVSLPVTEAAKKYPQDDYGKNKALIEDYLLGLTSLGKLNCSVLHAGHIVGRGWAPINPQGNLNIGVFADIIAGRRITLPDFGLACLHHVHSEDIARLALACIENPSASAGEAFNSVCAGNLTLRGYAEEMFCAYGKKPDIGYLPWPEFKKCVSGEDADITLDHIKKSLCCSMEKASRLLGFKPKYTAIAACAESVEWLVQNGKIGI